DPVGGGLYATFEAPMGFYQLNKNTGAASLIATSGTFTGIAFAPLSCDDNNVCSTDGCDTITGQCTHVPASPATVCRSSAGICDLQETCTGTSPTCPANGFASSATICRSAAGVCDVAETCTGSTAGCPPDVVASSATVCRS